MLCISGVTMTQVIVSLVQAYSITISHRVSASLIPHCVWAPCEQCAWVIMIICRWDTGMSAPWVTFPWMNLLSLSTHFHVLTTSRLACISGITGFFKCQTRTGFPECGEQSQTFTSLQHPEMAGWTPEFHLSVCQSKTLKPIAAIADGFVTGNSMTSFELSFYVPLQIQSVNYGIHTDFYIWYITTNYYISHLTYNELQTINHLQ